MEEKRIPGVVAGGQRWTGPVAATVSQRLHLPYDLKPNVALQAK